MFKPRVAYFSMEIALKPRFPTYSGGLGVVAGDLLRAAADVSLPIVGVTLAHRQGYFRQRLSPDGSQAEEPELWHPEDNLELVEAQATVSVEGRPVTVRAWRYWIRGIDSGAVPVFLLDTALPENGSYDRTLTDRLYGGDARYRLCQEAVLGIGGVRILEQLGYSEIETYHLNEGHSALLALALLERRLGTPQLGSATEVDIEAIRSQCVFTTHTPVPAGQDQFPRGLVEEVLGKSRTQVLQVTHCCPDGVLNMTYLALRFSRYINGVAMRHGEISQGMFPRYPIRAITNGVHAATWVTPPFAQLFDRHLPDWRRDNLNLRYAAGIPLDEVVSAHRAAKRELIAAVSERTAIHMAPDVLTLGFARRSTAYKRADLLLSDLERLRGIARNIGPFQVVYGGKAHPHDEGGKALIRRVIEAGRQIRDDVQLVFVENYELAWAKLLTSGVDVWLNTPRRPEEASGTSGMKAALNGVPSLSVLDGWGVEGCLEGMTGWSVGPGGDVPSETAADAGSLYDQLERVVVPLFYHRPEEFAGVQRSAIALNGSFFNTQRMLGQYAVTAYRLPGRATGGGNLNGL